MVVLRMVTGLLRWPSQGKSSASADALLACINLHFPSRVPVDEAET
jgi:hypothetical protein